MYTRGCASQGRVAYSRHRQGHNSRGVLTELIDHFVSKVDGLCHPNFTLSDHSQEAGGEARISYIQQVSVDSLG